MKDFFISYNDADRAWAEWIIWQLEWAGYRPVLDVGGYSGHLDLSEIYEKAELIILVLSPDYVKSNFTRSVLDVYVRDSKRVLPVRVSEYEPEGLLSTIDYIDLVGLDEVGAQAALLEGIRLKRIPPNTQTNKKRSQSNPPKFPEYLSNNINKMQTSDYLNYIETSFSTSPDAAWSDLHKLTEDVDRRKRARAARALGSFFSQIPDKENAWQDILRLAEDDVSNVREWSAESLGSAFLHIPDKEQAWKILLHLTEDDDEQVRSSASKSLGLAFPYVLDENKAWNDFHSLTENQDSRVRMGIAEALGLTFQYIPNKDKAWMTFIDLPKIVMIW